MEKKKYLLKSANLKIELPDGKNPWEDEWIISLTKEEREIGIASFAGEKALGAVPLRVELAEEERNQGYGTEAIRTLVRWAFHFQNIYEVTAQTEHENDKAVKAMGKAGFVYRSGDRHTEQYSIIKGKTAWTGLYILIGITVGIILGIVLASPKMGLGIGVVGSLLIGISMDANEKKMRERVTGRKED